MLKMKGRSSYHKSNLSVEMFFSHGIKRMMIWIFFPKNIMDSSFYIYGNVNIDKIMYVSTHKAMAV